MDPRMRLLLNHRRRVRELNALLAAWGAFFAAIVLIGLCACSMFPAKTFNERYAIAVNTCTVALSTTDHLLVGQKITRDDAVNVEKQIDNVKEALDLARATYATDQASGSNKLTAAATTLDAITRYLQQQQGSH